jgi:3-oxoacyl-[acyl-carrier protein] reductase
VNYASDKDGAKRTVTTIHTRGGKAVAIRADVSTAIEVKRFFEETRVELGAPSVLVNNAATYKFALIESVSEAEFRRHPDINVLGPMLAIQEALRHLPAEGGSILNTMLGSKYDAAAAYQIGADSGLLQKPVLDLAVEFQGQHEAHAGFLAQR